MYSLFSQIPSTYPESSSPVLVIKLEEDGDVCHKAEQSRDEKDEHLTDLNIDDVLLSVKLEETSTVALIEEMGQFVVFHIFCHRKTI